MPEPLRYVILHHTGVADPHYDLMFERGPGGALLTIRCPVWPITQVTRIEPLPDHRRDYLDYEGPISGGRGGVARIERGTYEAAADVRQPGVIHLALLERSVRLRLVTAPPDAASIAPVE